jgi:hypothetical protein
MAMSILGGLPAKALDFEGNQWVPLFEGDYAEAKTIMARLDAEKVPNRMAIPEDRRTSFSVLVEVMRRSLPEAQRVMAF